MRRTLSTFGILGLLFVFFFATEQSASAAMRKYYASKTLHTGAEARTACATGYHMASLGEIFNTSVLKYNKQLGITAADSGWGPPQTVGWIRTGYQSDNGTDSGKANCLGWTTTSGSGTIAAPFVLTWNAQVTQTISPWFAFAETCDVAAPVWCVEN